MFSTINHNIKIGEVISTQGDQVAIADTHEIWNGQFITVGDATIRIYSGCENVINTNWLNPKGVVCFLPSEFKGCAILKVKVTHIHNKSVEALPLDYIKADKPIGGWTHGMEANDLLAETEIYPNIKRVFNEGQQIESSRR